MTIKSAIEQIERELTMDEAWMKLQHGNELMKPELNDVINENLQMKCTLYTSTSNSTNTNMNELPQYDNNLYTLHY
jgi:hypothetical protein